MMTSQGQISGRRDWGFYFRLFVLAAAFVVGGLVLWMLTGLLLLAFGAILLAVLLRALASLVTRITSLRPPWSLLIAIVLIVAALAAFFALLGAQIQAQAMQLAGRLPEVIESLENRLGIEGIEDWVAERVQNAFEASSVVGRVAGLSSALAGALANLVILLVAGIYFAVNPEIYRKGILLVFPRGMRAEADETAGAVGDALKLWLLGQLIAMLIVGTLTAAGLWILGVPSALALGLIAGLLDFVPFVGPIVAALPALAVAATIDLNTVLWVAGLYLVVQQIEGTLITPLVQQRTVDLPPALTIFAILAFGILFGPLGVLFATPLAVMAFVVVKKVWVRDTLHEPVHIPGEHETERSQMNQDNGKK
jgi:predicted PurR-regulated permease PerM